ncbi:hypothetical protein RISK_001073 [Rhodopirellula islandica]|uniref:Uncharacterized protein n=1 Tax=Rhodopirellula islandica TaxID=595434 RepID=A0A0J1BK63_RHOIS|nr:hypothetical protein RISK_001073 [Rhodopirellula islandica]
MNQGSETTERIRTSSGGRRRTICLDGNFTRQTHRAVNFNQCHSLPIQHNQGRSTCPSIEALHLTRTKVCTGELSSEAKLKDEWASDSAFNTGHLEQRT